ncbi:MAG: porin [Armatimonadota bacterium]
MKGITVKKFIAALILVACCSVASAQVPTEVPQGHWAYESVSYLISQGYIADSGGANFSGNRALTRYEFASIIKRIIDEVNAKIILAESASKSAAPDDQKSQSVLTKAELDQINKLVSEFKPELIVIGTRLDKIAEVNAAITGQPSAVVAPKSDANKSEKLSLSGYVQARYNSFQGDPNSAAAADPASNFSLRKLRIKAVGKPSNNSTAVLQFDAGQNYTGSTGPAVTLKDAFIQYDFTGNSAYNPSMLVGQMFWPFGYELGLADTVRESPERSLIVERLFGGSRDRGAYVSYPLMNGKMIWKAGIFNGVQTNQTPNDSKASVSTVRFKLGEVDCGVSGWLGKTVLDSNGQALLNNNDSKTRYGADAQWHVNALTLKAEYFKGVGVDGGTAGVANACLNDSVSGGWAQAALNLPNKDMLAVKYEAMSEDPLYPTLGKRTTWSIGLLRSLDQKTRVKLYYLINEEQNNSFDNNAVIAEWITVF